MVTIERNSPLTSQRLRAWTLQTCPAWEQFQATGVLRAEPRFIDPDFLPAYDWMNEQLTRWVGPPPVGVTYPIWLWRQWEGHSKPPDLRRNGQLPRGQCGVRLECELSSKNVLLSDFDLWHFVLNNWYLPNDEADADAFEAAYSQVDSEACVRKKVESWQRIFDLDWVDPTGFVTLPNVEKSIQGVVWQIKLEEVKVVRIFTAR